MRVFLKEFACEFRFEKTIAEDAFSYLACKSKGYKFVYNPSAVVYFRSPNNLRDHLKQSTRFLQASDNQQNYFSSELLKTSYYIPKSISLELILKYFLINPFYFLIYLSILIYSKFESIFGEKATTYWNIAVSSKKL